MAKRQWKMVWTGPLTGYATDGENRNHVVIYRRSHFAFDWEAPAYIRAQAFKRSHQIPHSSSVEAAFDRRSSMKGMKTRAPSKFLRAGQRVIYNPDFVDMTRRTGVPKGTFGYLALVHGIRGVSIYPDPLRSMVFVRWDNGVEIGVSRKSILVVECPTCRGKSHPHGGPECPDCGRS